MNLKTTSGATALQHAAAEGNSDVVDLLLKAGCAMNLRALNNVTALYNAANGGHLAIVRRLLDAGAEADAATTSGSTALHAAASNGHAEVRKHARAYLDVQWELQHPTQHANDLL